MKHTILYIGGFQLPDKNAAAQRVIGIAKGLHSLGYNVVFLNSMKGYVEAGIVEKEYFGFKCYEYKREHNIDYLLFAKTTLSMIKNVQPYAVIAYNYPAFSLNRIRQYCKIHGIKCFADTTEWYDIAGKNLISGMIKGLDTFYRMRYVQKKMDGVIAISRYLYDYYRSTVKTVLIPPTVDIEDIKWKFPVEINKDIVSFVYAGVPSANKERLDRIVSAVGVIDKEKTVRLNVVGITEEQFTNLYEWKGSIPKSVVFWGRVEHQKALQIVKQSDWCIIIRENSRLVQAGFPTKLVESISCGTPVLSNKFSNVFEYLTEDNSICIESMDDIVKYMLKACDKKYEIDCRLFDYHNYLQELYELIVY